MPRVWVLSFVCFCLSTSALLVFAQTSSSLVSSQSGSAAEGDQGALSPTWILPLAPAGYGGPGVINPYSNVNPLNPMAAEMQARAAGQQHAATPQQQLGPSATSSQAVNPPPTASFLEITQANVPLNPREHFAKILPLRGHFLNAIALASNSPAHLQSNDPSPSSRGYRFQATAPYYEPWLPQNNGPHVAGNTDSDPKPKEGEDGRVPKREGEDGHSPKPKEGEDGRVPQREGEDGHSPKPKEGEDGRTIKREGEDGHSPKPKEGEDGRTIKREGGDGHSPKPKEGEDGRTIKREGEDGYATKPKEGEDGRVPTPKEGEDGRIPKPKEGEDGYTSKPSIDVTPAISTSSSVYNNNDNLNTNPNNSNNNNNIDDLSDKIEPEIASTSPTQSGSLSQDDESHIHYL